MKVFQFGDEIGEKDFVMARDEAEAKLIYAKHVICDPLPVRELSKTELDEYEFCDDIDDPKNSPKRSFAAELAKRVKRGDAPDFFATNNF